MFRDDAIIANMLRIDAKYGLDFPNVARLTEATARKLLQRWVKWTKADIQTGTETIASSIAVIDAMCYDQLTPKAIGQLRAIYMEISDR